MAAHEMPTQAVPTKTPKFPCSCDPQTSHDAMHTQAAGLLHQTAIEIREVSKWPNVKQEQNLNKQVLTAVSAPVLPIKP